MTDFSHYEVGGGVLLPVGLVAWYLDDSWLVSQQMLYHYYLWEWLLGNSGVACCWLWSTHLYYSYLHTRDTLYGYGNTTLVHVLRK